MRSEAWTVTDECDLGRTSMDARQAVLKTAGSASDGIHYLPHKIDRRACESIEVREDSQTDAMLAVFSAVTLE
jgi:hypothetical protein